MLVLVYDCKYIFRPISEACFITDIVVQFMTCGLCKSRLQVFFHFDSYQKKLRDKITKIKEIKFFKIYGVKFSEYRFHTRQSFCWKIVLSKLSLDSKTIRELSRTFANERTVYKHSINLCLVRIQSFNMNENIEYQRNDARTHFKVFLRLHTSVPSNLQRTFKISLGIRINCLLISLYSPPRHFIDMGEKKNPFPSAEEGNGPTRVIRYFCIKKIRNKYNSRDVKKSTPSVIVNTRDKLLA